MAGKGGAHNPAGLLEVGKGFEQAGDRVGALSMYQQALAADQSLWQAEAGIARVFRNEQRYEQAVALFSKLLRGMPDNTYLIRQLSFTYAAARDFSAAEVVVTDLLGRFDGLPMIPDEQGAPTAQVDMALLDLAGRLAEVRGDGQTARSFYDKVLSTTPGALAATQHLGLSFALDGTYETAIAILQPVLAVPAFEVEARETLALIYALSGQAEASAEITRAAKGMDAAAQMKDFFRLLPNLPRNLRAEAVLFGGLTKASLDEYFEIDP